MFATKAGFVFDDENGSEGGFVVGASWCCFVGHGSSGGGVGRAVSLLVAMAGGRLLVGAGGCVTAAGFFSHAVMDDCMVGGARRGDTAQDAAA